MDSIGNIHKLQQSYLIACRPPVGRTGWQASHGAPLSFESGKLTLVSLLYRDSHNHS